MFDSNVQPAAFRQINSAYYSVFRPGKLSLGLVVPIETYDKGPVPTMQDHLERVQLAERLGFASVWLRDVPFNVPTFGDAGQLFDPFVYLGLLAGQTSRIGLGVASIVLPLRHPAHVAKAAASVDALSGGRLLMGIASGDRPQEFPAMNIPFDQRGDLFRASYDYIRGMSGDWPDMENSFGRLSGQMDLLPKPAGDRIPMLITGSSQQADTWIAANGDGWMTYPRPAAVQSGMIADWRQRADASGAPDKPVMEPLYIDLVDDPDQAPTPIHLGLRTGIVGLRDYLKTRESIGVNHIALNLRFNNSDVPATLARLSQEILPEFGQEEI